MISPLRDAEDGGTGENFPKERPPCVLGRPAYLCRLTMKEDALDGGVGGRAETGSGQVHELERRERTKAEEVSHSTVNNPDEFIAMVSHDLKNLIGIVSMSAAALSRGLPMGP